MTDRAVCVMCDDTFDLWTCVLCGTLVPSNRCRACAQDDTVLTTSSLWAAVAAGAACHPCRGAPVVGHVVPVLHANVYAGPTTNVIIVERNPAGDFEVDVQCYALGFARAGDAWIKVLRCATGDPARAQAAWSARWGASGTP